MEILVTVALVEKLKTSNFILESEKRATSFHFKMEELNKNKNSKQPDRPDDV